MARQRRRIKQRNSHATLAIIVDGETERWYLQMMRQVENYRTIRIEPDLQKLNLERQFGLVCEKAKEVDQVIWLLDTDTLIKELEEDNTGQLYNQWNSYISRANRMSNVEILFNTPCLEYWFLLHLQNTSAAYNQCTPIERILNNSDALENYEKTEKYYKNPRLNIYERLLEFLPLAKQRANSLGRFNLHQHRNPKAEMYRVFEIIESML